MPETKALTREEIFDVLDNPLAVDLFNNHVSSFFITILPDDVKDTFEGHQFDVTIQRLEDGSWIVKDRLDQYDLQRNKQGNYLFSPPEFRHSLQNAINLAFMIAPNVTAMNMLPHEFPDWLRKRRGVVVPEKSAEDTELEEIYEDNADELLAKFPGATIDQAYSLQACLDDWDIPDSDYIYTGPDAENHVTIGFTTDEGEERVYIIFPDGEIEVK